jgi:hypothetical protein
MAQARTARSSASRRFDGRSTSDGVTSWQELRNFVTSPDAVRPLALRRDKNFGADSVASNSSKSDFDEKIVKWESSAAFKSCAGAPFQRKPEIRVLVSATTFTLAALGSYKINFGLDFRISHGFSRERSKTGEYGFELGSRFAAADFLHKKSGDRAAFQ